MRCTGWLLLVATLVGCGDFAALAPVCPSAPCDLYLQCGCEAAADQVCDLDPAMLATGATACRLDALHGEESQTCSRQTTCAAGHGCIGGRCLRYCQDDDDCPGPGGLCVIQPIVNDRPIPGVTVCTTDCAPTAVVNAACPADWACHVFLDRSTGADRYLSDCTPAPASGGAVGAACTDQTGCSAGLDCVTLSATDRQCRPNCACPGGDCGAGTCPAATGSCHGFMMPVVIGSTTYGTCY